MNTEKLNKWAELLLDTGKRNNLIHFKDTKMGSVEILSPDFVTLFNRAEHSALFEVYDPKLEDEEEGEFVVWMYWDMFKFVIGKDIEVLFFCE